MPYLTSEQMSALLDWAQHYANQKGRPLSRAEREWAALVGVQQIDDVTILMVNEMPTPPAMLEELAVTHLDPKKAAGLTLGHTILVRKGCYSRKLLQHELRHVQQVEKWGFVRFFEEYARQILENGYKESEFESDAIAASLLK